MKRNRAYLEQQFPVEYIRNGLNGRKAYRAIRPSASEGTAGVEASRLLTKPKVQKRLMELLPNDEVESDIISSALSSKITQPMTWKDKHKYLVTSLTLKGYLKDKPQNQTQVNIIIEN